MTPRATGLEIVPVAVSERTSWLVVRLSTNVGICGIGEVPFLQVPHNRDKTPGRRLLSRLASFYDLLGESLSIQAYRRAGWPLAVSGRTGAAAAFSAIELALWDIRGKLLGAPVHELLGGRVRDSVPVYANINRMTSKRTPAAFADSAALARDAGFRAVKAAPFDGFPAPDAGAEAIEAATDQGIDAMFAIREAVGAETAVKVDCHSHFDLARSLAVAERLEPVDLDWYEEPLPVSDIEGARTVRSAVAQRTAGGETLLGLEGFVPLVSRGAVDVVMPDVMLCGGILEMLHVARMAETFGIAVSPHNPCGSVATAAALAVCAAADNVESLELQWGEVDWRASLIDPPECVQDGFLAVGDRPGLGIELRSDVRPLPVNSTR